ncbi:putative C6 transcription factor [Aspergillus campestris IBT 28561]|uniref:C6 transcription factor n=1 Tax=Aspergillus campestris (strain IBT 28561) TaxID=1392248 RepID=A0A2I1CZD5_ASPC2|nr:putative C6 transcription factor [Aspergillus campestris IBT 28561]PKY02984.1 putative C6 transcription factor [Aspergillus campestris IBT 28561]
MSDPSRPPHFLYDPYNTASVPESSEHEAGFSDWSPSNLPFGSNYEGIPGFPAESSTAASRNIPGDRSLKTKVAIPRSTHASNWTSSGRVSRACENCREQKAKCSGHRPTCQRCQEAEIRCSYGDRKREKTAKCVQTCTHRIQTYQALLREIVPKLDSQTAQHVEGIVNEKHVVDRDQSFAGVNDSTLPTAVSSTNVARASSPGPASGTLDYTNEDFNRDEKVQAMGFVGEHSEVAWMYRLKQMLERTIPVSPEALDRHSLASVNYFVDETDIPVLDDVDITDRPPQALADYLADIYFEVVHPSFPIIGKVIFLKQLNSFYTAPFMRPGKRWLAILHLIFAIAAKYSHYLQDETDDTPDGSLSYFSRAWKLSNNEISLLDHPNLQQVQVEGLTSFYLLLTGQVNRSWRLCGLSMRSAVTMGLNLRSESSSIAPVSKETRYRVWWSLYMLDSLLCVMTGRPPSSSDDFRTTPLPLPFREEVFLEERVALLIEDHDARNLFMESLLCRGSGKSAMEGATTPDTMGPPLTHIGRQCEQLVSIAMESLTPNFSLYFLYLVDLVLTVRETVDTIYAPGAARKSWRDIEAAIAVLNGKVDAWHSRLSPAYHFTQGTPGLEQQRTSLAFHFYSTKILISQPCLSRLTRHGPGTETSGSFCDTMADVCVNAAGQMIELFPELPDPTWVYHVSPWWCILHFLTQPLTVLLIELLLRSKAGTIRHRTVLEQVCKVTRWLSQLSTKDSYYQRAWLVCKGLYTQDAGDPDTRSFADKERN